MNHWMSILLSLSLSGVVLTLVLLALTRLLGRRLGRRWQYYVWGIVVLRLLLPIPGPGILPAMPLPQAGTFGEQQKTAVEVETAAGVEKVAELEAAEKSSQSALEANKLGYEVGVRINIDVLNAQTQLFNTQNQLSKARYDLLTTQLKLKQAVGKLSVADLEKVNAYLRAPATAAAIAAAQVAQPTEAQQAAANTTAATLKPAADLKKPAKASKRQANKKATNTNHQAAGQGHDAPANTAPATPAAASPTPSSTPTAVPPAPLPPKAKTISKTSV